MPDLEPDLARELLEPEPLERELLEPEPLEPEPLEPEPLEPRTVIRVALVTLRHVAAPVVAGMSLDPPTFHLLDGPADTHPVDVLVGFDAPAEWAAVVAVAGGTSPTTGFVMTAASATRRGRRAAVVAGAGCEPLFTDRPQGRLIDACLRCLGLGTDPPPSTIVDVIRGLWLDRVMERVVSGGPTPTWTEIVRLHPAWTGRERVQTGALLRREDRLVGAVGWPDVRAAVRQGRLRLGTLCPVAARWMDDGMFARAALAELPDRLVLRTDLGDLLPDRLLARLDRVLDGVGEEAA